jgi:hypothetical protein
MQGMESGVAVGPMVVGDASEMGVIAAGAGEQETRMKGETRRIAMSFRI